MTIVRIDKRYCGPPDSGNGGYFAGLLAAALGGSDVQVTLKRPAPLDRDLTVNRSGDGAALYDGDELLALAEPAAVELDVPSAPGMGDAVAAETRFDKQGHIYPGCFVCGPDRADGDGWRIFPGSIADGRVAATWSPPSDICSQSGHVLPEFIWAALDCPGYFAAQQAAGLALLGRIAVSIRAPVRCGDTLIVQGWAVGSEGRKHRAGTALHTADGRLLAFADQLWISLR